MFDLENFQDPLLVKKRKARNYVKVGALQEGLETISSPIGIMEELLEKGGKLSESDQAAVCGELADCYGIQGGIYRRMGLAHADLTVRKEKLLLSYESYDEGYKFEKLSHKPVSYNMLNRLVSRVFFEPEWLGTGPEANSDEAHFLKQELQESAAEIENQLRKGRDDIWCVADLGLNKILLKAENPKSAFSRFVEENPGKSEYNSLLIVLQPLSELAIEPQENIKIAVAYLEAIMNQKK